MELLCILKDWQELIAGLFTLVAGWAAYKAAMRQIEFQNEHFAIVEIKKKRFYLKVLTETLKIFVHDMDVAARDVQDLRSFSGSSDIRNRLNTVERMVSFDESLLSNWDMFREFSGEQLSALLAFRDSYAHHQGCLSEVRRTLVAELPLLRAAGSQDSELERLSTTLGAFEVAIDSTKEAGQKLLALVDAALGVENHADLLDVGNRALPRSGNPPPVRFRRR